VKQQAEKKNGEGEHEWGGWHRGKSGKGLGFTGRGKVMACYIGKKGGAKETADGKVGDVWGPKLGVGTRKA